MKTNSAYIAIVLDRSGSMNSVKEATITGFNEFLNQQKQLPGECRLLLAQFDDSYEIVYDKAIAEATPLTSETFVPRGLTALHDAIGKTVKDLGQKLAAMKEQERPDRVLVCIITDGGENCSRDYGLQAVADAVKHQRETYKWDFVFIGANQDAVLTAKTFNIAPSSALTYNSTATGTAGMTQSLATYVSSTRSAVDPSAGNVQFSPGDRVLAQQ